MRPPPCSPLRGSPAPACSLPESGAGTTALVNPTTPIDCLQIDLTDEWVCLSFTDKRGPDEVEPLDHPDSGLRLWLTRERVMSIRAIPGRSSSGPGNARAPVPQIAGIDVPRARLCETADLTSIEINRVDLKG